MGWVQKPDGGQRLEVGTGAFDGWTLAVPAPEELVRVQGQAEL